MSLNSTWYKEAIFYELHVKAFYDSNNDGIGDFKGLTEKLDYLQDLGIDCIWLLPFYPSPQKDGGYDISDFCKIQAEYGTIKDFKTFLKAAHKRNIKVIADLVMNHTSDQHPWFKEARSSKKSKKRKYYVWSNTDQKYKGTNTIFTDTETSNWAYDKETNQYYWHRFYSHQPDLNYDNPKVRTSMLRVLNYWLNIGLDGFRCDAVPYLFEKDGTNCENLPGTHEFLKEVRKKVDIKFKDKVLLAEANQKPEDVRAYFGDGDEFHMAFHFPLMPRIFAAIRQETSKPIVDIINHTPKIPENCQWGLFLRNHDELTLAILSEEEKNYMYKEFVKDFKMLRHGGIGRRLSPLLDNGRRQTELLNNLLMTMPGSPIIYYGDEIGMGDNIYLGDRDGLRTPMQWTIDRNAGFSKADSAMLYSPVISDPVYGYQSINVDSQSRTATSLLSWMKRLIRLRKKYSNIFGRGEIEFLKSKNEKILAYIRRYEDQIILIVNNLSRYTQPIELDLSAYKGFLPVEPFGNTNFPNIGESPYFLTIGPHNFYWFKLEAVTQEAKVKLDELKNKKS